MGCQLVTFVLKWGHCSLTVSFCLSFPNALPGMASESFITVEFSASVICSVSLPSGALLGLPSARTLALSPCLGLSCSRVCPSSPDLCPLLSMWPETTQWVRLPLLFDVTFLSPVSLSPGPLRCSQAPFHECPQRITVASGKWPVVCHLRDSGPESWCGSHWDPPGSWDRLRNPHCGHRRHQSEANREKKKKIPTHVKDHSGVCTPERQQRPISFWRAECSVPKSGVKARTKQSQPHLAAHSRRRLLWIPALQVTLNYTQSASGLKPSNRAEATVIWQFGEQTAQEVQGRNPVHCQVWWWAWRRCFCFPSPFSLLGIA